MSNPPERTPEEQLDLYLDGMLSAEERSAFEKRLGHDLDAVQAVRAQQELDAWLRVAFSPPAVSTEHVERSIRDTPEIGTVTAPTIGSRHRLLALVALGLAVSILCVAVFWNSARKEISPFFQPRPLANIYRETVSQGFRPYYVCDDDARFAMTFAKRQRVPLRLTKMPDDRRMLGLSYPGGLSRSTTAVLCYAENQPVIVFVDTGEVDNPSLATSDAGPDLNVYRTELGTLVIYEISPLEQAKISSFLKLR